MVYSAASHCAHCYCIVPLHGLFSCQPLCSLLLYCPSTWFILLSAIVLTVTVLFHYMVYSAASHCAHCYCIVPLHGLFCCQPLCSLLLYCPSTWFILLPAIVLTVNVQRQSISIHTRPITAYCDRDVWLDDDDDDPVVSV